MFIRRCVGSSFLQSNPSGHRRSTQSRGARPRHGKERSQHRKQYIRQAARAGRRTAHSRANACSPYREAEESTYLVRAVWPCVLRAASRSCSSHLRHQRSGGSQSQHHNMFYNPSGCSPQGHPIVCPVMRPQPSSRRAHSSKSITVASCAAFPQ